MYRINHANIKEWAANYEGELFDGILCDPPYELGFMGKSWDSSGIAFDTEMWADILKLLKPGGHLLAFSGSRTYHRMAVAIEDAGFEIRDQLIWMYGSGFPKSLNIGKSVEALVTTGNASKNGFSDLNGEKLERGNWGISAQSKKHGFRAKNYDTETTKTERIGQLDPTTDEAKHWNGYGTALKPAHEPCVLARKPLDKGMTVAGNVLKHGVGGLNIDGSRVVAYNVQDDNTKGYRGSVKGEDSKRDDSHELPHLQQRVQSMEVSTEKQKTATNLLKNLQGEEYDGGEKPKLERRNLERQPNRLYHAEGGQAITERPKTSEQEVKGSDATQSSNGEKSGETVEENGTGTSLERSLRRQPTREPVHNGLGGTQQRTSQSIERDDSTQGREQKTTQAPIGRWPSNLIHDGSDEVEAVFPQTGNSRPDYRNEPSSTGDSGIYGKGYKRQPNMLNDSGSASRFFYCAKASKSERNAGLEGFEEVIRNDGRDESLASGNMPQNRSNNPKANHHPTVKPLSLTKYLATLIKPPSGGRLLVPFSGSGSEMIGALQAGWEYVEGVELTEEYIPIAEARIEYWLKQMNKQLEIL